MRFEHSSASNLRTAGRMLRWSVQYSSKLNPYESACDRTVANILRVMDRDCIDDPKISGRDAISNSIPRNNSDIGRPLFQDIYICSLSRPLQLTVIQYTPVFTPMYRLSLP